MAGQHHGGGLRIKRRGRVRTPLPVCKIGPGV